MKFLESCKNFFGKRWVKILIGIIAAFLIIGIICATVFVVKCSSAQSGFRPIESQNSKEHHGVVESYVRSEETTYLTYPEWYLVFNPQEYAEFLAKDLPSRFPYFKSIEQFWSGYCEVYGITKNNYEFNADNHIVATVIGASFSVEYIGKGVYEHTIGRISELTAHNEQTQEDKYAAKIAKAYGEFIPTDPWYAFSFGRAFTGLWSETDLWGPHVFRKWERKFALSFEYGIKATYAQLIGLGTRTTLGTADTEIYARVKNVPETIFENPRVRKIVELTDGSIVIAVPHYQGFTDTVPTLAQAGIEFIDVAGNDEILMTIVTHADWKNNLSAGSKLFTMPILTGAKLQRVAIQVPVNSLSDVLRQLKKEGVAVEHLFDY